MLPAGARTGVFHHFYQIHLAALPGHGPDYGHFVSKDFISWAQLPVAIWNGLDNSAADGSVRVTKYDNEAIFTGSAVIVDGAGPGGVGKGVVNIYPGLCNKNDWPGCGTGTLLAQAVPADYAGDQLLEKWAKPSYNPIMENTQRDPSTPWQTSHGEWRLRTYDASIYGAASSADMLAGKWYKIGVSKDLRQCECPSLYPLPAATPGTEQAYAAAAASAAGLPTHVHKTSCGGDWWQLGTYTEGPPKVLGHFNATAGWEDVFAQKKVEQGHLYASKDNAYPALDGSSRRVNWGWATVPPASTQTLPRAITFNAAARTLQQAPIEELKALRGKNHGQSGSYAGGNPNAIGLPQGVAKQSEIVASFTLPAAAASFSVTVGDGSAPPSGTPVGTYMEKTDLPGDDEGCTHHPKGTDAHVCQAACAADAKCVAWTYVIRGADGGGDCCPKTSIPCPVPRTSGNPCTSGAKVATTVPGCGASSSSLSCTVEWTPPAAGSDAAYVEVPVSCGTVKDTLRILRTETIVELRVFYDATFAEAYFQQGRVAMTVPVPLADADDLSFSSTAPHYDASVDVYAIKQIWTTPDAVRAAPRTYAFKDE